MRCEHARLGVRGGGGGGGGLDKHHNQCTRLGVGGLGAGWRNTMHKTWGGGGGGGGGWVWAGETPQPMHKTWGRGVGCGLEKHHNQCTRLGVGGLGVGWRNTTTNAQDLG